MDNDTARDRAVAESVEHIEAIIGADLPDAELLVIEEAIGLAYEAGYDDALNGLRSSEEVAEALNVSRARAVRIAEEAGVGRAVGNRWVFTDQDIRAMGSRKTKPGPAGREVQQS